MSEKTVKFGTTCSFKFSRQNSNIWQEDKGIDIIWPLWIVLPSMSGCIKYFDNDWKNMSLRLYW